MFKNESAYISIQNTKFSMKTLVRSMSLFMVLLFGAYVVMTGKTIYNVVNKKNIEQDIASSRSELANLENDLFAYYNSIHKESLPELGFVAYSNEVYANPSGTFVFNQ